MGLENQGAKPSGIIGIAVGRLMNKFQTSLYTAYFNKKDICDNAKILDIGCGGGKFLKYLSQRNSTFNLWGLDHSNEMIGLSSRLNKESIAKGKLKLLNGSISKIEIEDNTLNLITALETIQFWSDTDIALSEVYRILNNGGKLIIANRYPKEGTKWWNMAKIKSEKDYKEKLEKAGFSNISTDLNFEKGWIIVEANKN